MKHDETVVLGLVLIVAAIGGLLLVMEANRPVDAAPVVPVPAPEVQRPWPSSGMATALTRCRDECLAREDLEQDGIDYCLVRCDKAYLV